MPILPRNEPKTPRPYRREAAATGTGTVVAWFALLVAWLGLAARDARHRRLEPESPPETVAPRGAAGRVGEATSLEAAEGQGPTPQPELAEPRKRDPGLRDLSRRDWKAVGIRAGKEMLDDNMTMIASALAYSMFFAVPSVLLVVIGVFSLVASPATIETVVQHLGQVLPTQATQLLHQSLDRLESQPSSGVIMTVVGFVLALWSTTGAMTGFMTALNLAYDRKDTRSFVKKRLTAVTMAACLGVAFLLITVLLVGGPLIERYLGSHLGLGTALGYVWWSVQWPILIAGLSVIFATLLWLAPDVEHPRWTLLTPGTLVAVVLWLASSGLFAVYTSMFGSYNKTWGSLSAVIVLLTWFWLTNLALLFGAELNAELERSRELRQGRPATVELRVPARA